MIPNCIIILGVNELLISSVEDKFYLEYDAECWQYSFSDNDKKLGITGEVISFSLSVGH